MRFAAALLVFLLFFVVHRRVSAEISSESCGLLRTMTSLTKILPEFVQLAMRSYRASLIHHREKRFFNPEKILKTANVNLRGTVIEQMIANTIRDVNFTSVALLMLQNNDTMNKIQENLDVDLIIRTIIRGIDQEKLAIGFFHAASKEFDFEHFIVNIINRTQIENLHDQWMINGTLPDWLLKSFHPGLNQQNFRKFLSTTKNFTEKILRLIYKYERVDKYLFNIILDQTLTPLNNLIQKVQQSKAKTFDQFLENLANNTNKILVDQLIPVTQRTPMTTKKIVSTTSSNVDDEDEDPVGMIYQWSIGFNAMGETSHVLLKSLEQLYCPIE